MELFLHMGYNTQSLILENLDAFGGGTVIASPVNSSYKQLVGLAKKVHVAKGAFIIDPQLYYPRRQQEKLRQYAYWPKGNFTDVENGECDSIVYELVKLNNDCKSDALLLPSPMTNKVNNLWDRSQRKTIDSAKKYSHDKPLIHTITLSAEVMQDESQIENAISYIEKWDINGIYIVCERPRNQYLVDRPLWLFNLMSLVAGVKRQKKSVIVGHVNHQMLCLAMAKCDAIASGNFINLRCFQPERFDSNGKNEPRKRSVWYYCPQTLSEYTIPFLDIAQQMDLLDIMAPQGIMKNSYSDTLFDGDLPTSTEFNERMANRHYLYCLRQQCLTSVRSSYQETKNAQLIMLETARQLLSELSKKEIINPGRNFSGILEVNLAAISGFDSQYSQILSHEWEEL